MAWNYGSERSLTGVEKEVRKDQEQDQAELSPDELDSEQAAELPDREALSLITPSGIGSFTPIDGSSLPPQAPPYDTIQPVEPNLS